MLKYAVLILWRKRGAAANFYAFCISGIPRFGKSQNEVSLISGTSETRDPSNQEFMNMKPYVLMSTFVMISDTQWWMFILLAHTTSVSCLTYTRLLPLLMSSGWWVRMASMLLSILSLPQPSSSLLWKQVVWLSLTLPLLPWGNLLSYCTLEGMFCVNSSRGVFYENFPPGNGDLNQ